MAIALPIFSIEGRQVHEAYLVIDHTALMAFYLPGEARFSPLDPSVQLPKSIPMKRSFLKISSAKAGLPSLSYTGTLLSFKQASK